MTFHHMYMVKLNSLNKQEDNKHIRPLSLATPPKAEIHKSDCKVDTGVGCNIMPLYIYRSIFRSQRLELPMMITRYGNSLVITTGSCIAVLLTGCQAPRKAVFQVTDTRGYLVIERETARKLGYAHFLKITLSRLIQQPKMPAHLKAIKMKT